MGLQVMFECVCPLFVCVFDVAMRAVSHVCATAP